MKTYMLYFVAIGIYFAAMLLGYQMLGMSVVDMFKQLNLG